MTDASYNLTYAYLTDRQTQDCVSVWGHNNVSSNLQATNGNDDWWWCHFSNN